MDVVAILENNSEYFSQNVFWVSILRSIGWTIAKGLKSICDFCENLYSNMYSLIDFTQYPALKNFFNTFRPVIAAILILSIFAFGIMLIMGYGHGKGFKVAQNTIIFVAVITALPILMDSLNNIVLVGKNAVYDNISNLSSQLMVSDVDDVAYMINKGFDDNEFKFKGNNISTSKITNINITEVMEPGGIVDDTYKELITTKLESLNDDGTWETSKIKDKWFDLFDTPYYFRYRIDFLLLYVGLISLIIGFLCTSYKVIRIIFEIVTTYMLATLFSAQITGEQKILKILDNLKNLYIALLMTAVMLRIYTIANDYISKSDFNEFTKTFALLFFTFCLIDGPNIIERLLGIDIGLKSGWGKVVAGVAAARGMAHAGTSAARTARNIAFGNPYSNHSRGGIVGMARSVFENMINKDDNESGADHGKNSSSGASSENSTKTNNEKKEDKNQQGNVSSSDSEKGAVDNKGYDKSQGAAMDYVVGAMMSSVPADQMFTDGKENQEIENEISDFQNSTTQTEPENDTKPDVKTSEDQRQKQSDMLDTEVSKENQENKPLGMEKIAKDTENLSSANEDGRAASQRNLENMQMTPNKGMAAKDNVNNPMGRKQEAQSAAVNMAAVGTDAANAEAIQDDRGVDVLSGQQPYGDDKNVAVDGSGSTENAKENISMLSQEAQSAVENTAAVDTGAAEAIQGDRGVDVLSGQYYEDDKNMAIGEVSDAEDDKVNMLNGQEVQSVAANTVAVDMDAAEAIRDDRDGEVLSVQQPYEPYGDDKNVAVDESGSTGNVQGNISMLGQEVQSAAANTAAVDTGAAEAIQDDRSVDVLSGRQPYENAKNVAVNESVQEIQKMPEDIEKQKNEYKEISMQSKESIKRKSERNLKSESVSKKKRGRPKKSKEGVNDV